MMKKLFCSVLLATSLVAIGSSASAADLERTRALVWTDQTATFNARYGENTAPGQTFLENFTFTIDNAQSAVSAAVISIALDGVSRLSLDSFALNGAGSSWAGTSTTIGDTQTFSLRTNGLALGTYTLSVAGSILGSAGGSFAGNISIAAVPEASTTAMMLGGLALVGFGAMRRRRNGGAKQLQSNMMVMA